MIRINLLPQTRKQAPGAPAPAQGGSLVWAVLYIVVPVLVCVALAVVYISANSKLDEHKQQNAALQTEIQQLTKKSERLDEVKEQLERSKQLESVVNDLNRARIGPARVLMELSRILSVDGGPTIDPRRLEELRRDNPLAGFNRGWDPRRLWLSSFMEDRRTCSMKGLGKTNEDVAEFLRRLALSDLFQEVTLQKTEAVTDQETRLPLIGFELTCKVNY